MRLPPALYAMRLAVALLLAFSICTPAFAQTAVDLQLVLAVDASGSVDQRRFELQMQGYVAAFRDPRVLRAIQAGVTQAIAVTMVQWTGPALQIQVLPWTLINDATTAHAFAAAIAATPRRLFSGGTSISGVIDYAVPLLLESPFKGTRLVIAAESYETFADAILKKLIREMATNEPRPHAGLQLSRMPQCVQSYQSPLCTTAP